MPYKSLVKISFALLTAFIAFVIVAGEAKAEAVAENGGARFGVIKGVVLDKSGKPISNATVSVFKLGTSKLLKQVTASSTGKFFAKLVPGTYTILAVAQGFNAVTLKEVKVNREAELVYGFKLERSGSGNTLPEKRADRNSAKWRVRAQSARRSIYQNHEGESPIDTPDEATTAKTENVERRIGVTEKEEDGVGRKGQTIVETFVASNNKESYTGFNFATLRPLGENAEVVFAGQIGKGKTAPKRFETNFTYRPNERHQVNIRGSIAKLGKLNIGSNDQVLSQASVQALDQWSVAEGIVVVVGLDYSRFLGVGSDSSIRPRLGFQFDINSKTRVRAAYTTQTEQPTWQRVIELEGNQVLFRDPIAIEDIVVENDKPLMNKSRRIEFGVERILDNRSSVEANVFFDSAVGRGVGLAKLPFDDLGGTEFGGLVASQHGNAQGLRVVYSRRLNNLFTTSAGYSFGNGQKLSQNLISNPAKAFDREFFQSVFGELNAYFETGTTVKAIYRLSPKATVFAIDPFQGRLAIYDPGLSFIVTQDLPVWGLPIDAEAVLDAKNILDFQGGVEISEGLLTINSQKRIFRGGILVRF